MLKKVTGHDGFRENRVLVSLKPMDIFVLRWGPPFDKFNVMFIHTGGIGLRVPLGPLLYRQAAHLSHLTQTTDRPTGKHADAQLHTVDDR